MIISGVLLNIGLTSKLYNILLYNSLLFFTAGYLDAFLRFYVGMSLMGIRLKIKKLLLVSLIHAITVVLTRFIVTGFDLPILLVLPISILTALIILTSIARMRVLVAFAVVLLGMVLTIIGDSLFIPIALNVFNIDPRQAINTNIWTHTFLSYVASLPYIIVAVLTWLTPIKLGDFSDRYQVPR